MKIGIDLDGVIFDSERLYRAKGELFDIAHGGKGQIASDVFDVCDSYDWNEELRKKFIETVLYDAQEGSSFMPCAVEVIKRLKDDGHKLYIITARGNISQREIDISLRRLKEVGLEFDGYHFSASDKLKVCQAEKIDVMIDDCFRHINAISQDGINCLYFREQWIPKCQNEKTKEVHNWGEIYRAVLELQKSKS